MKALKIFVLALIALFSITSCRHNPVNERNKIQPGWTAMHENGYSLQYPDDWDINVPGPMGSVFNILSKPTNQQDQFRENVNLIVQDLTGYNLDLDKYAELSVEEILKLIPNSKLIENSRKIANGIYYEKVIYTGDQAEFKLKFEQYYWIRYNKAYVLTLACEVGQFDNYKEVGEKILNSFRFD